MSDDARKWGHAATEDAERFEGDFESRDAVIAAGRKYYGSEPFWILEGKTPVASSYLPDADDVVEWMEGQAYDEAGEAAESFTEAISSEGLAELEQALEVLKRWADEYVPLTFWCGVGKAERIEP